MTAYNTDSYSIHFHIDKFNFTVQGTLSLDVDNYNAIVDSVITTSATTTVGTHLPFTPAPFEFGSILFFVLVVLGGGMLIITFGSMMFCIAVGFLSNEKRRSNTITAAFTQRHHNSVEILECQNHPQNQGIHRQ